MKIKPPLFLILLMFLLAGCTGDTEGTTTQNTDESNIDETFELSIVSFLPENHQFTRDIIPMWIERVEEGTNGAVTANWTSGPESIPNSEQFDAVSNGIVDVGFNTSSFYGHLMPEALSLHISSFTPEEERENGYYNYLDERFNEHNQVYLGRFLGPNPFYFWTNTKVETLEDYEGLQIRSNPTYHEILVELGVEPIEVVPGEVYTALERNMVDGFGFPILGPYEDGWTEVTQYLIEEPFLNQNATIQINQDTFESLPDEIQSQLVDITAEFEHDMIEHFNNENEITWDILEKEGVERVQLEEQDSKDFQKIVNDVYWTMLERDAPGEIEELRTLLLVD